MKVKIIVNKHYCCLLFFCLFFLPSQNACSKRGKEMNKYTAYLCKLCNQINQVIANCFHSEVNFCNFRTFSPFLLLFYPLQTKLRLTKSDYIFSYAFNKSTEPTERQIIVARLYVCLWCDAAQFKCMCVFVCEELHHNNSVIIYYLKEIAVLKLVNRRVNDESKN